MFAYCRNNPISRKDASGTEDVCATDVNEDNNHANDLGGPTGSGSGGGGAQGGGVSGGSGSSTSNSAYAQAGSAKASASSSNASSIPQYAYDTLEYIKSHNGSPPKGYKGGKPFANDGRDGGTRLPDRYAPFREYDVHPKVAGQNRGAERIVVGTGAAFYTPNHYTTFIKME